MENVTVQIVNAFVDGGIGGNAAGVVLNAERFNQDTRQAIAAKVGYSETAFVSDIENGYRLEFFTPNKQIADCGHATVATFSYLAQQGILPGTRSMKETIIGRRDMFIRDDLAFMEQAAPTYTPLAETAASTALSAGVSLQQLLSSLNITEADLLPGKLPMVVNTGVNFMIVPLRDEATVLQVEPDQDAILAISEELDLVGYYAFSQDVKVNGRHAGARMFAPRYAIPEESATGMAAGPLACYLYDQLGIQETNLVIEQGHLMTPPSPSEIFVELGVENGRVQSLLVGGRGAVMATKEITI